MKNILLILLSGGCLFAQSLSLSTAYQQGLEFESKLKSLEYQTSAKKEEISQAKASLYPQVEVDISGTKRHYIENYNANLAREKYYTATLTGKLSVYDPTIYNNIDQAKIKYRYTHYKLIQMQQQLAFDITDAYMSLLKAQNSLLVAKSYVESNKVKYEQIQRMYEKELSNKMDLFEARVTYDSSKVKVNSEKHNVYLAKLKLKNLTGITDISLPKVDFEKIKINNLAIFETKKDLENSNLEIQKSNLAIDLSHKQIKNAQYQLYPKVDLSASYSKYDAPSKYTDYTQDSRLTLTFRFPLYKGGYVKSKVAQSRYLLSASQEDLKDVEKQANSDFEGAQIDFDNAKQSIALYKDAIASAKLYLHSVERGYEKGLKSLIDVEDAKTKLYENRFKLIDSTYNYIKSYVSLLNLLGKLDNDKLVYLDEVISLDK